MTIQNATWEDVPDTNLLPLGWWLAKIGSEWNDDESSTGKAMVKIPFIIVPHGEIPEHYYGKQVTSWYVLGSKPDGRIEPQELVGLKRLLVAAGVPLDTEPTAEGIRQLLENAVGAQLVIRVSTPKPKNDRDPMNSVGACKSVDEGEELIGLDEPEEAVESSTPPEKERSAKPKPAKITVIEGYPIPNTDLIEYTTMPSAGQEAYRVKHGIEKAA